MGRPENHRRSGQPTGRGEPFLFFLMPGFSALELGSGIDSLSAANDTLGKTFFHWKTVSETGDSIVSSSGLNVAVDSPLPDIQRGDCIVVCCAFNSQNYRKSGKAVAWLGALREKASNLRCGRRPTLSRPHRRSHRGTHQHTLAHETRL